MNNKCYICEKNKREFYIIIHSLTSDLFVCENCMIEMLESFKEIKIQRKLNIKNYQPITDKNKEVTPPRTVTGEV